MNSDNIHDIVAQEWIGRTIDSYQIMLEIGQGRHGVLFLGEEETTHESVAVKILYPGHTSEVALANARVIRALHHPGLAAVRACGTAHGFSYIISEYIQYKPTGMPRTGSDEGLFSKNLLQYVQMRAGLLTEKETADIICQLLDVLQYVHGVKDSESTLPYGGVHPNNILLQERADGTVKIFMTDTGLPCTRDDENDMDAYISPEELQGQIATQHSDIYSLGAMIHLLLAGVAPGTPLVMPTDIRTDIAAGWNAIIRRCLAYEPLDRFPDYQALRVDILSVKKLMPKRLTFAAIRYAIGAFVIIGIVSLAVILILNMRDGRSPGSIIKQIYQQNFGSTPEQTVTEDSATLPSGVDELLEANNEIDLTAEVSAVPSDEEDTGDILSPDGATTVDTASVTTQTSEDSAATPGVPDTVVTTVVVDAAETIEVSSGEASSAEQKPSAMTQEYDKYTVRKNDTYYSLARQCGISVVDLLAMNNLTISNMLQAGVTLRVPAGTQFPPVKDEALKDDTGTAKVTSPSPAKAETDVQTTTYKVQKGDTYFSLARRYKISVPNLMKMNANKPLQADMSLKVPVLAVQTNTPSGESHDGAQ